MKLSGKERCEAHAANIQESHACACEGYLAVSLESKRLIG